MYSLLFARFGIVIDVTVRNKFKCRCMLYSIRFFVSFLGPRYHLRTFLLHSFAVRIESERRKARTDHAADIKHPKSPTPPFFTALTSNCKPSPTTPRRLVLCHSSAETNRMSQRSTLVMSFLELRPSGEQSRQSVHPSLDDVAVLAAEKYLSFASYSISYMLFALPYNQFCYS